MVKSIKNELSITKCKSYEISSVRKSILDLLKPFGGIRHFVKPNTIVLLKPNMLSCKSPDFAATTHPAIVEVVANLCIEIGAKVIIGDSPPVIFGKAEKYWRETGFKDVADKTGAELLCFEKDEKETLKINTNNKSIDVHVIKTLFNVDTVINLPKMKTHNLTRITGAVKNYYGLIPGLEKARWHSIFSNSIQFGNFIADFASKIPTHLSIMDAIEAMEGQGPAGGNVIKPGLLLASPHPVCIDLAFCKISNITSESVPVLKRCKQIGFGPNSLEEVKIHGDLFPLTHYDVPDSFFVYRMPSFVVASLRKFVWARPQLTGVCIKCGRCIKVCPAGAISIEEGKALFNKEKCVSCFCCMEVCPQDAIEMKLSPLLKIAKKLKSYNQSAYKEIISP